MKKKILSTVLVCVMAFTAVCCFFGCKKEEQTLGKIEKMIAIGDSITCGTYAEGFANNDVVWGKVENTFSEIIKNSLKCENLKNYGYDGISISSCGQLYPEYSLCRYIDGFETGDLVLVAAGTNDYGNYDGVDLGTVNDTEDVSFYGALHVFFTKLNEKYSNARIYVITPIRREGEEYKNPKGYTLSDYRKAIEEKCKEFGLPVIDGTKIAIDPTKNEDKQKYILDGLHPNAEGHKLYAKYVLEQIFKMEKAK